MQRIVDNIEINVADIHIRYVQHCVRFCCTKPPVPDFSAAAHAQGWLWYFGDGEEPTRTDLFHPEQNVGVIGKGVLDACKSWSKLRHMAVKLTPKVGVSSQRAYVWTDMKYLCRKDLEQHQCDTMAAPRCRYLSYVLIVLVWAGDDATGTRTRSWCRDRWFLRGCAFNRSWSPPRTRPSCRSSSTASSTTPAGRGSTPRCASLWGGAGTRVARLLRGVIPSMHGNVRMLREGFGGHLKQRMTLHKMFIRYLLLRGHKPRYVENTFGALQGPQIEMCRKNTLEFLKP